MKYYTLKDKLDRDFIIVQNYYASQGEEGITIYFDNLVAILDTELTMVDVDTGLECYDAYFDSEDPNFKYYFGPIERTIITEIQEENIKPLKILYGKVYETDTTD